MQTTARTNDRSTIGERLAAQLQRKRPGRRRGARRPSALETQTSALEAVIARSPHASRLLELNDALSVAKVAESMTRIGLDSAERVVELEQKAQTRALAAGVFAQPVAAGVKLIDARAELARCRANLAQCHDARVRAQVELKLWGGR